MQHLQHFLVEIPGLCGGLMGDHKFKKNIRNYTEIASK